MGQMGRMGQMGQINIGDIIGIHVAQTFLSVFSSVFALTVDEVSRFGDF